MGVLTTIKHLVFGGVFGVLAWAGGVGVFVGQHGTDPA